jgi:hypothetical protein
VPAGIAALERRRIHHAAIADGRALTGAAAVARNDIAGCTSRCRQRRGPRVARYGDAVVLCTCARRARYCDSKKCLAGVEDHELALRVHGWPQQHRSRQVRLRFNQPSRPWVGVRLEVRDPLPWRQRLVVNVFGCAAMGYVLVHLGAPLLAVGGTAALLIAGYELARWRTARADERKRLPPARTVRR